MADEDAASTGRVFKDWMSTGNSNSLSGIKRKARSLVVTFA